MGILKKLKQKSEGKNQFKENSKPSRLSRTRNLIADRVKGYVQRQNNNSRRHLPFDKVSRRRPLLKRKFARIPISPPSQNIHEARLRELQNQLNEIHQFRENRRIEPSFFERRNKIVALEQERQAQNMRDHNLMATKLVVDKSSDLKPARMWETSEPNMSLWQNSLSMLSPMGQNDFSQRMSMANNQFSGRQEILIRKGKRAYRVLVQR